MLLDSNIIIYAAEPQYDAVRKFIAKHKPSVSAVSKVEVLGYHQLNIEHRQKLERIFQLLPVLAISDVRLDCYQSACAVSKQVSGFSLLI